MKKVFISQPMKDRTLEDIKEDREALKDEITKIFRNEELQFIDTLVLYTPSETIKFKSLWYLSKSIELMATADLVVFHPDWEYSRGCVIEHECAVEYGLKIFD